MKTFNSNQLIDDLKEITRLNMELISKKMSHLSEEQKKWKPSSESWNLLEILSHLNAYAAFYHTAFTDKIQKTKFKEAKLNFVSS
ncbi:MAG: hypothetical protein R3277_13430, partial [Brumimicrobium sp.]|nr:hypothetical protein [Brumimicrobium sp.]